MHPPDHIKDVRRAHPRRILTGPYSYKTTDYSCKRHKIAHLENVLHLQCGLALQQESKRISNCKIRGASLQSRRRICGQCAGWGDCDEEAQCHTHRLLLHSHLLPSDSTKWINAKIDAQEMIQQETLDRSTLVILSDFFIWSPTIFHWLFCIQYQ